MLFEVFSTRLGRLSLSFDPQEHDNDMQDNRAPDPVGQRGKRQPEDLPADRQEAVRFLRQILHLPMPPLTQIVGALRRKTFSAILYFRSLCLSSIMTKKRTAYQAFGTRSSPFFRHLPPGIGSGSGRNGLAGRPIADVLHEAQPEIGGNSPPRLSLHLR